jgi:hypothetical protein
MISQKIDISYQIYTVVPFCHYSGLMMTAISSERISARVSAQIKQTLTDAANLSGARRKDFLKRLF